MLDQPGTIEHTYEEPTPASIAVIQALAAIEDVEPADLEFVLYDYVNPDALDLLIGHESATGAVELRFTVEAHRITVRDTGRVTVEPVRATRDERAAGGPRH